VRDDFHPRLDQDFGPEAAFVFFCKGTGVGYLRVLARQLYTTANTPYTMSESQQLPQNVPPHLMDEFLVWFAAREPQTQSGIRTIPITISLSPVFVIFANFWYLS